MPRKQHVAVIGAGAGGLSAARHLLEEGHEVTVFEAGSHVGGLWVYDNDNGLSVAYDSLTINSEPRVTSFRGYPFPPGTPFFPAHQDVAAYLNSFADKFEIRPRIRFNSRVSGVRPVEGGDAPRWTVELEDGSVADFDGVVVASGHQGVPAHPEWARDFQGEYLHSHSYRSPEAFKGKRVLVVGVGNSGLDIAADLAPHAAKTYSSARSPVLIMPRLIYGVPSARVIGAVNKPFLPWIVQRQIMRFFSRVYFGRMEQWGLQTPKTRTHPASNATYMAHVSYGRIVTKPGVDKVDGRRVTFSNGEVVEVDTIIAATGYHLSLPFLGEYAPIKERRLDAYKRVVHPDRPGLYFIGFFNVSGGANISMMDVQAELLAAVVSARLTLPSPAAMKADIVAEQQYLQKNFPGAARYGLELDPRRYRKQIGDLLKNAERSMGLRPTAPQNQTVV